MPIKSKIMALMSNNHLLFLDLESRYITSHIWLTGARFLTNEKIEHFRLFNENGISPIQRLGGR